MFVVLNSLSAVLPKLCPVCPHSQGSLCSSCPSLLTPPSPHFLLHRVSSQSPFLSPISSHCFLFPLTVLDCESHFTLCFLLNCQLGLWGTLSIVKPLSMSPFQWFFSDSFICVYMHLSCFHALCPLSSPFPSWWERSSFQQVFLLFHTPPCFCACEHWV